MSKLPKYESVVVHLVICYDQLFKYFYKEILVAFDRDDAKEQLKTMYPHLRNAQPQDLTWQFHKLTEMSIPYEQPSINQSR